MPWACAASSFLSLVIGLLYEPLNVKYICQIRFSFSEQLLCCQPQHNSSEQHYQTQCNPHLNNASCGKQSLISFGFVSLNSLLICLIPAFLFLPMLSPPRVLCCSILSWKRERELSSTELLLCWLAWYYVWMCVLMD